MTILTNVSVLDNLGKDDIPAWGSMSAQHMIEHLALAVRSSNGGLEITEFITPIDRLPIAKRILMSDRPLPKNFVNTIIGKGLKPLTNDSLESAKNELISELEKYEQYYNQNPTANPVNATFGPLNKTEWDQFHKKHFKHHLEQFRIIL